MFFNFGRESIPDRLIAENVNEFYGSHIVDFLNEKFSGECSNSFYKLVNDDYKLWRGIGELV